ncbi:MAG TPA: hypothetical protein VN911_13610 [Candidatus Acidoferrum sp.]|nr:hypothetical protein [Candidatus Acidoferrum sp.]
MKRPPEAYWSLFKVAHERVVPLLKERIHPGLLNPVFGLPPPKGLETGRRPSPNERYWLDWFQEFSEIDGSMKRLNQALAYLSHYPHAKVFRFHKLSEADWIRYHIEAYLQETYILYERLRRFLRKVEKVGIIARDKVGLGSVKKQKAVVDASFKNVVRARGGHVHDYRFQDDELRDLDTLVLVTSAGRLRELRWVRRYKFDAALLKWRRQILGNNRETEKLCVAVFGEMTAVLTRNEPTRSESRQLKNRSPRRL